jgi:hypothetical protein
MTDAVDQPSTIQEKKKAAKAQSPDNNPAPSCPRRRGPKHVDEDTHKYVQTRHELRRIMPGTSFSKEGRIGARTPFPTFSNIILVRASVSLRT